jgi:hypothetical protein
MESLEFNGGAHSGANKWGGWKAEVDVSFGETVKSFEFV